MLWQLKPEYHQVMWSESSCRPVGVQLWTDQQLISDPLATVSCTYVYNKKIGLRLSEDKSATDGRWIADHSVTENRTGIVCNYCAWLETSHQPVVNQVPNSLRPPKTLQSIWWQRGFTCSNQNLLLTKSSLRLACNSCNLPVTSQWHPCNLPATAQNNGCKVNGRL